MGRKRKEDKESIEKENQPFPRKLRDLLGYNDTNNEKWGERVKLAKELNVSGQTISKYAYGDITPNIDTLSKIANYFHRSADEFLGLPTIQKGENPVAEISSYTNLNDSASKYLLECSHDINRITILNMILNNEEFQEAILYLTSALVYQKQIGHEYKKSNGEIIPDGQKFESVLHNCYHASNKMNLAVQRILWDEFKKEKRANKYGNSTTEEK